GADIASLNHAVQTVLGGTSGTLPSSPAPSIAITSPVAGVSALNTISLGGTASDTVSITQVTWSTDRGASGIAVGTTNWTANIPWQTGVNGITVTVRDGAGSQASATVAVTYSPQPAPSISITSPTTAPTFSASTSTITLGGTSSDTVAITQVTWSTDR